jgi:sialate O-acetylesterase
MHEKILHQKVLQRDSNHTKIVGVAEKHGSVKIQLSQDGKIIETYTTHTRADGHWATFIQRSASGPYIMHVATPSGQAKYINVMFGDVFFCSGQSNSNNTFHY